MLRVAMTTLKYTVVAILLYISPLVFSGAEVKTIRADIKQNSNNSIFQSCHCDPQHIPTYP
jgi:hypothetical protein